MLLPPIGQYGDRMGILRGTPLIASTS